MGRGRQYGPTAVLAAGVAGAAVALWLVLPGLDEAGARVTMGLKFALPVLAFAAAAALRRDIVFHIGVWATAAALSMTMLVSANITLALTAGALSAVAAVAAVVLSVFPSSAPSKRVGLGAAVGVSIALVMLIVVGQIYDIEGVAAWRWWLPLAGVPALLLLPKVPKTSSATGASTMLALCVVIAPAIASIVLAALELAAASPAGF